MSVGSAKQSTRSSTTLHRASSPADWAQATTLLHEYAQWMRTSAGFDPFVEQPSFKGELRHLAAHYADPSRSLYLASQDGPAVGTIAVTCHADGAAELKRMYVRPVARGRGVADRLLGVAVSFAASRGSRSVWLETVRGPMDAAIAVYRRNGFDDAPGRVATLGMPGVVVMERPVVAIRRSA